MRRILLITAGVASLSPAIATAEPVVPGNVSASFDLVTNRNAAGGFFTPIDLHHPGDGDLYYADITGRIVRDNGSGVSTFLDISNHPDVPFTSISAGGLLGITFHPGYSDPVSPGYRKLYTYSSDWKTVNQTGSNNNVSPGNELTGLPDFWHPEMYAPADGRGSNPLTDWTNPNSPSGGNTDFDHFNVIREWTATGDGSAIDGGVSPRVVLRMAHGFAGKGSHNGGGLRFGSDGYLYLSTGDGGGNAGKDYDGNPFNGEDGHTDGIGNGQDRTNVYGAVLRIDPTAAVKNSANGQYGIPADNPYVLDNANPDFVDELYANGFRNPWKLSFDTQPGGNGALYLADVGQHHREEINQIVAGGNYGWGYLEGRVRLVDEGDATGAPDPSDPIDGTDGTPVRTPSEGFAAFEATAQAPLLDYLTRRQFVDGQLVGEGTAVTGGFVYRGSEFPELYGKYVFGDYSTGGGSRPAPEGLPENVGRLFYFDPFLDGDFNEDGVVDAADYTVWRDAAPDGVLPNDRTSGVVDAADLQAWADNYGGAPDPTIYEFDVDYDSSLWGSLLGLEPGPDGEIHALLSNGNVVRLAAPGVAAAPEPTAVVVALLAACPLATRQRVRRPNL